MFFRFICVIQLASLTVLLLSMTLMSTSEGVKLFAECIVRVV